VLNPAGALRKLGWFRSVREKRSVDAIRRLPLPWLSYPAIEFIGERLDQLAGALSNMAVAARQPWFAQRCKAGVFGRAPRGVARRDLRSGFRPTRGSSSSRSGCAVDYLNVAFTKTSSRNEYSDSILSSPRPDVVVIDGIFRNACAAAACEAVSESGVLIYDNTDFPETQEGIAYLRSRGWRQLRFVGMSPIFDKLSETSVFYKASNCWNI
jgi:hypothetical protein